MRTRGNYQWALNVTQTTDGRGDLCSQGWLHAYPDTLTAAFMCHYHCAFKPARMFEAETGEVVRKETLKLGTTELTLTRELAIYEIPLVVCVRTAIAATLSFVHQQFHSSWEAWAKMWLAGEGRGEYDAANAFTYVDWYEYSKIYSFEAAQFLSRAAREGRDDDEIEIRRLAAAAAENLNRHVDLPPLLQAAAAAEGLTI
jgi:hypothetical protein